MLWQAGPFPRDWHIEEISELLSSVGFSNIDVAAKVKQKQDVDWQFRALREDFRDFVPMTMDGHELEGYRV